jgi:hypothetical protein
MEEQMKQRSEKYSNILKTLDGVSFSCSTSLVPLLRDALVALQQQLVAECQRAQEIREEKNKLAPAYNRYVALHKELQGISTRTDELVGMLGSKSFVQTMLGDPSDAIGNTLEVHTPAAVLQNELPLWKAIRWFLEYYGEARMTDVLIFLGDLNPKWQNRNAVESALRLHTELFQVRKVKGDKFISLKGA